MKNTWIKQDDKCIMNVHIGLTLLIMLNDESKGITIENDSTVDISYLRSGNKIYSTTGVFEKEDIIKWQIIE